MPWRPCRKTVAEAQPTSGAPSETTRSLWRDANFLPFWAATTISLFGSRITSLALPLAAIEFLDAGAFELGLLGTFGMLPFLVVSLIVGVWVDHIYRRPVLIAADVLRAALLITIPVAFFLGALTMWQLYVVALLTGVCDVLFDVAYDAYVPGLVGRNRLVAANARIEASRSVASVAGPGIAGVLIGLLTAPVAIALDAVSYLLSGGLLATIRHDEDRPIRRPSAAAGRIGQAWQEGAEGLGFVMRNPYLRGLAGTTATFNLFNTMAFTLVLLFASEQLGLSAEVIGIAFSIGQAGALLGVAAAGPAARRLGLGRAIVAGGILMGWAFLLLPAASPETALPLLIAFVFVMAFGIPVYNINQRSLRQALTPDAMLGRMTASMRFLVWGTIPLGAFLGGVLGNAIGIVPTLWLAAAGTSLAFVSVLLSPVRRLTSLADVA